MGDYVRTDPYHRLEEDDIYCPFCESTDGCRLDETVTCRYGLTRVTAPDTCPLLQYPDGITVRLYHRTP